MELSIVSPSAPPEEESPRPGPGHTPSAPFEDADDSDFGGKGSVVVGGGAGGGKPGEAITSILHPDENPFAPAPNVPLSAESRKNLYILYFCSGFSLMAYNICTSIFAPYALSVGASTLLLGALSSVIGAAGIPGAWILGFLSDLPRFGRRFANVFYMAGVPLGYVVVVLSPTLGFLFAGLIVNAIMTSGTVSLVAYISDLTAPGEQRTKYLSISGAILGLAVTLGSVISVVLLTVGLSINQMFWIAIIAGVVPFVVAVFFLKEPEINRNRKSEWSFRNPNAESLKFSEISRHHWFLFFAMFTSFYGYNGPLSIAAVLVLQMFGWGATQLSALLLTAGILFAIGQLSVQCLVKRFPLQKLSIVSSFILGITLALLPNMPNPLLFLVDFVFFILSMSFMFTTIPVQLSEETPQSRQGQIQSLSRICQTVAGVISPLIAASVFDLNVGKLSYGQGGAVAFFGGLMLCVDLYLCKPPKKEQEEPAVKEEPFLTEIQRKSMQQINGKMEPSELDRRASSVAEQVAKNLASIRMSVPRPVG